MNRRSSSFSVVLLACIASFACSSASPTGATGGSLLDRLDGTWTLVAQQPAGEQEAAPPSGSTFTFQIVDGVASVKADCNRCSGAATIGNGTLTLGPALACTRAFCTTSAPFDTEFVRLLADENAASIAGDTLTLQSSRGALKFKRN